ncbi:hypothetical protein IFM89_011469 [Coptis chinensis]|uniref:Uncharacterized protein n=1 Tax=Coptis chinensis TaxID=261450 RepID=A0A835MI09_9MAGN|nr:hypothetical protein IFM89_011469 [Coptis chinensis]
MYEEQNIFDLEEENGESLINDPKSWLSGEDQSPSQSQRSSFDRVLYKNLVEMIPLVESLMDGRANSSFTRRASMVYTKTPYREMYPKKIGELKGRKAAQSILAKKRGVSTDEYSIFTARPSSLDKDREPLLMLQEQVESLQKKLLEKDELLKSTEKSVSLISSLQVKLDELKCQVAEKDSLFRSVHLQLSEAKINLADKQAALEKLRWEASESNRKVEKLREDLESMQGEVSTFMLVLEGLIASDETHSVDYDIIPYNLDQLSYIDHMNEMEMQKMEEARETYIDSAHYCKRKPR